MHKLGLLILLSLLSLSAPASAMMVTNLVPDDNARNASASVLTAIADVFGALAEMERSGLLSDAEALRSAEERLALASDTFEALAADHQQSLAQGPNYQLGAEGLVQLDLQVPNTEGEAFQLMADQLDRLAGGVSAFRDDPGLNSYEALYEQIWRTLAVGSRTTRLAQ